MTTEAIPRLLIKLADAKEPFRVLKRLCKPKKGEEAILSYDGACLHIECSGVTVAIGASGDWKGQARVLGSSIMSVIKHPPSGDPLVLSINDGLSINSITLPCVWQAAWRKVIDLPMNYTLEDVAALGDRYTEQDIVASGLGEVYKRAINEFPRLERKDQSGQKGKPGGTSQLSLW